ncbi:MAG: hypothetical protein ACK5Z5_05330 [Neisseriaceae bacterium]
MASVSATIAKTCFLIFIIGFLISLFIHLKRKNKQT